MSGSNKEASLRAYLIKGSSGSMLIKATHAGLLTLSAFVFARLMGAEDYGTYAYIMSWVAVLLIPALLGMDTLLVRQVAIYHEQSQWALLKGVVRFSSLAVLAMSTILAICAVVVARVVADHSEPTTLLLFWLALVLIPLLGMIRVQLSVMRGLHAVVRAHLPELVIQHGVLLLLIITAYYVFHTPITPLTSIVLTIVAAAAALALSTPWSRNLIPPPAKAASPIYEGSSWLHSSLPLLLMASMGVINSKTDIIMLGSMLNHQSAGVYAIASQLSGLVAFILVAVNTALAPAIARLHSGGEMARLQSIVTRSTRLMLAGAVPVALIMALFGHWMLSLFGSEFTAGLWPLRILIIGQVVNVAAGSVGWLLTMTGHERDAAIGISTGAAANIILNGALIPVWGMSGAAVATASSMTLWNIILVFFVFKRLGIYSLAHIPSKLAEKLRRSYT